MSESIETGAVVTTVQHYLSGISDANNAEQHLHSAFYSSTNLHTVNEEGELHFIPRDNLVSMAKSGSMPEHKSEILSVEVTNDMAFAKVHLDLPDRDYFDYLTLLKLNSGWKIVSKTYTTLMK